jgi:transposase, IS5 family
MSQRGFWDEEARQEKLAKKNTLLPRLAEMVPWESFRETLEQAHPQKPKSKVGRKRIDAVLMFKLLVLQKLYNISDDELEYQVNDRLSFMRFLGLGIEDMVPDRTTVWLFREELTKRGLVEELFDQLEGYTYSIRDTKPKVVKSLMQR